MKYRVVLALAAAFFFGLSPASWAGDIYVLGEENRVLPAGSTSSYTVNIDNPNGCLDPLASWTLKLHIESSNAPEALMFQNEPTVAKNYLLSGRSDGIESDFTTPSETILVYDNDDFFFEPPYGVEVPTTGKSLLEVELSASSNARGRYFIQAVSDTGPTSYWGYFDTELEDFVPREFSNIPFADGPIAFTIGSVWVHAPVDTSWTGASNSNWNDSSNWTDGKPGSGAVIQFDAPTASHQPETQDIADPLTLQGIIFTSDAGGYTLDGEALQFAGSAPAVTCVSSNDQSIGNSLDLTNDTEFFVSGLGTLNLQGGVTGSGSLIKSGSGTLKMECSGSYTGETVIEDGVFTLDVLGQLGNSTLTNDATFRILDGPHIINTITGDGTTEIFAGSLTASSITQKNLTIGNGITKTGPPLFNKGLNNDSQPVPEPANLGLLAMAFFGLLAGKCVYRKWK